MKVFQMLCLAALALGSGIAHCQAVPPIDHIGINDPRIFNLSDDGSAYALTDGPLAAAELSIVHGPSGTLAANVAVQDNHLNTWGPVALSGKLSVKGTLPLKMRLNGGGKGEAKVKITGSYDAPLKLMRVLIVVKTPEGLRFQWNDAFVPDFSDNTGIEVDRVSVASNFNGMIKGEHNLSGFGLMSLGTLLTTDRQLPNSDFQVKAKGAINVFGDYNNALDTYSVFSSKASLGYGTFFTPGSLVTVTSDNLFLRNF